VLKTGQITAYAIGDDGIVEWQGKRIVGKGKGEGPPEKWMPCVQKLNTFDLERISPENRSFPLYCHGKPLKVALLFSGGSGLLNIAALERNLLMKTLTWPQL
jgi:hypothetical protein